jgi:hypothetical protein
MALSVIPNMAQKFARSSFDDYIVLEFDLKPIKIPNMGILY